MGPLGDADLHFQSPQPDTSSHRKTTNAAVSASHGISVYFPAEAGSHFTDPGGMEG